MANEYQDRRADDPLPDWIQRLSIPAKRWPAVREGQDDAQAVPDGFATAWQAFIARK